MRLYVTSNPRMRFSVKCAFPHLGKRGAGSRKSAFCGCDVTEKRSLARARRAYLTEKRILHVGPHGKAHSVGLELAECVFT